MKRIISLVLSIMMIGSCFMVGCGKKNQLNDSNEPQVEETLQNEGKNESQSDLNKQDSSEKDNTSKNDDSNVNESHKKDEMTSNETTVSKPNTSISKPSTGNTSSNKPSTIKPSATTQTKPQQPKPEQSPSEAFSGDLSSILKNIAIKGGVKDDMPRGMDTKLSADNIEGYLGISSQDYKTNISDAMIQEAMIISQAHMISIIKAKDVNAATNVKNLIEKSFNPRRWVCVQPDKCVVIKSGSYVLFVASFADIADGMINGFKNIAGSTADTPNYFFKGME